MLGIVKWFKEELGYGFVVDENGEDYFVHYSGILSEERFKKLYPLQMVDFKLDHNEKGPIAVDVTKVDVSDEVTKKFVDILVDLGYDMKIAEDRLNYVKKRDKLYKGGKKNEQSAEETH